MARRADLKVVLSGTGGVQPNFETAMLAASLDTAWKMNSDSYPNVEKQIQRILDCTNQDLAAKELIRRVMRFDMDYEADPRLMAIQQAYINSVAAAPTGTPANQVQLLVRDAGVTAGYFSVGIVIGGFTKWTARVPYNVTAANLKRAIENLAFIGRNNTTVAYDSPSRTWTITFVGNLANAQLPQFVVDNTDLTGGTVVQSQTVAGVQRQHAISRLAGFQPVTFGMIVGFENNPGKFPKRYKSIVANTFAYRGSHATPSVTANMGVIGSGDVVDASSTTLPACQVFRAARFRDCRLVLDGVDYQANNLWRNFELTGGNAIIDDDDMWTAQDEDIHRAERGDQRPFSLNVSILGVEGDDVHSLGEQLAEVACSFQIGRNNNGLLWTLPKGSVSLRNPAISYDGTAKRTVVNLNIEPELPDDGSAPYSIIAYLGQTATLLTPAV